MIALLAAIALQSTAPYHLVITVNSSTFSIPYPNEQRCRAALRDIEAENVTRRDLAERNTRELQSATGSDRGRFYATPIVGFCLKG